MNGPPREKGITSSQKGKQHHLPRSPHTQPYSRRQHCRKQSPFPHHPSAPLLSARSPCTSWLRPGTPCHSAPHRQRLYPPRRPPLRQAIPLICIALSHWTLSERRPRPLPAPPLCLLSFSRRAERVRPGLPACGRRAEAARAVCANKRPLPVAPEPLPVAGRSLVFARLKVPWKHPSKLVFLPTGVKTSSARFAREEPCV